jgi:outer membrane immunogenic protein
MFIALAGLTMRHFRFAMPAAMLFVAGTLPLSVSDAYAFCIPTSRGSNSATANSWAAGASAGYNWQQGNFVYGFETDFSGTGLKSSMTGGPTQTAGTCTSTANTEANVDWYGTGRGRVGWAAGQVLFYGTGGLAYGKVDLSSNFSTGTLSLNSQTSSIRIGWVAGGGIDYMLLPNVFLNFEYQYVDLGTANLAVSATDGVSQIIGETAGAHAAFHVVTAGLSWRISPTDTAPPGLASKSWEGMYFGGHAGGAWGNRTNANYSSQSIL